jgi:membrane dipeptidase
MSLTHSATHRWADSVGPVLDADYDPPRYAVHGGLAPFGREVVREMNRLGMIVDLSHASEATIDDVLEATRAPVMAARSGCRALVDLPRNLTDRQIKRIAAGGGIVMIHFGSASLDREVWGWVKATGQRLRPESARLRERHARDPAALAAATRALWAKAGPPPRAPWTRVVDHVEHVIRIAGDDAVGLGAGFEGVASAPVGLEDVSLLPRITEELLRRGHSEARVRKVLGEGFLAFFARVEAARAKLATEAPSAAAYRK